MAVSSIEPRSVRVLRGALITVGLLLLGWLQPDAGNSQFGVAIGLLMQILWGLALWLVRRYEQRHRIEGTLQPTVTFILELLIDAITVALFAEALLRHWWQAGYAL
ncbi:MAG TPA: hypothetical protein VFV64_08480 [Permianibacter sp.]|nr:hypothetical protein [Permianibacter sp.]